MYPCHPLYEIKRGATHHRTRERGNCLNVIKCYHRSQSSHGLSIAKRERVRIMEIYKIHTHTRYIDITRLECAHTLKPLQAPLRFFWPLLEKHLFPHKRISLCVLSSIRKLTRAASNELKSTSSLSLRWLWCRLMMIVLM